MIPFIKTESNLTLFWDGKTKVVPVGTPAFDEVMTLIKRNADCDAIISACDLCERVKLRCHKSGLFSTDADGNVWVGKTKVAKSLSDRIVDFAEQGLPFGPLIKFWNNCVANPDARARTDLFAFLQQNGHAITEDGCFIAYRYVNSDFKDCRTNSMDNSVGALVTMDRSKCDSDPNMTCSTGLHVASCNYAWAHGNGGHKICVKVNPKDVVAIPTDYNNQKMRCCAFIVVAVHMENKPLQAALVDDNLKPKCRQDYNDEYAGCTNEETGFSDMSDYEHQKELDREKARKASKTPTVADVNRGWQNLRDAKGRFYRKYI